MWRVFVVHGRDRGLSGRRLVVLGAKPSLVAGVTAGDADVDLMALADRQRCGGDGRFESGFLGLVIVLGSPVVEHGPALRLCDDHIFGQSHRFLLAIGEQR